VTAVRKKTQPAPVAPQRIGSCRVSKAAAAPNSNAPSEGQPWLSGWQRRQRWRLAYERSACSGAEEPTNLASIIEETDAALVATAVELLRRRTYIAHVMVAAAK
jgi:hypothetical protein